MDILKLCINTRAQVFWLRKMYFMVTESRSVRITEKLLISSSLFEILFSSLLIKGGFYE